MFISYQPAICMSRTLPVVKNLVLKLTWNAEISGETSGSSAFQHLSSSKYRISNIHFVRNNIACRNTKNSTGYEYDFVRIFLTFSLAKYTSDVLCDVKIFDETQQIHENLF